MDLPFSSFDTWEAWVHMPSIYLFYLNLWHSTGTNFKLDIWYTEFVINNKYFSSSISNCLF